MSKTFTFKYTIKQTVEIPIEANSRKEAKAKMMRKYLNDEIPYNDMEIVDVNWVIPKVKKENAADDHRNLH